MFFLIGHRGVGKTNLVRRLDKAVDLDTVIEDKYGIQKIFSEQGEKAFRDIEREELSSLIEKKIDFISLGAGFELKNFAFPKESKFIWIQRSSDLTGRVFFDRPRLDTNLEPLDEFFNRAHQRISIYNEYSDFKLCLEEGDFKNQSAIDVLKSLKAKDLKGGSRGYFTPSNAFELEVYKGACELKTDVFSKSSILEALKKRQDQKTIVSIRSEEALDLDFLKEVVKLKALIDLPLEYKESSFLINNFSNEQAFLSLHEKRTLKEVESLIENHPFHLKWAPVIDGLDELIEYDSLSIEKVSFLPRSSKSDGRYKWYRLLRKNKIEFYRYGLTEHLDQPQYYESFDFNEKNIGAVIGDDTLLSWSPAFHRDFFKDNFSSTYLNIKTERNEFKKTTEFIHGKGVRFLSVTSPFKKEAGEWVGLQEQINTLDLEAREGLSTDQLSIEALSEEIFKNGFKAVLVWGSGSMGEAISKKLNNIAEISSSRTESNLLKSESFEALIWASGPNAKMPEVILEQKESLKVVYDLNYKEESLGRLLALKTGALYISGKDFFDIQARGQTSFFKGEK